MLASERRDFGIAMMPLAAVFRIELSEAAFEAFWLALADLPLEEVQGAVVAALKTCTTMPTPAHLRSLAGDEPASVQAERAWMAVRGAIRSHGRYASVDFGAAGNAAVRGLGGWLALCNSDSDEMPFHKKDFVKTYEMFVRHGVTGPEGAALMGLHGEKPRKVAIGEVQARQQLRAVAVEERPAVTAVQHRPWPPKEGTGE